MNPKMLASDAAAALDITLQAVHKKLKSKGLLYEKSQNRLFFFHETAKEFFGFKVRPTIFATQVVKGGTGKTTLLGSLAVRLNLYGLKVLCIDLDQQANLTSYFGVNAEAKPVMIDILIDKEKKIDQEGRPFSFLNYPVPVLPGLDIIPSRIENAILDNYLMVNSLPLDRVYRELFRKALNNYDVVLIDCPPALGQSVAAASMASDIILSPVNPEKFCIDGLKVSFQELNQLEHKFSTSPDVKIIFNKFDTRTNLSHSILQELLKDEIYGSCLFKSYIRLSQEFPNCSGKGISVFDGLRPTAASEDMDLWTKEIIDMIKIADEVKDA